jgi:predicted nucleotidyltransferase
MTQADSSLQPVAPVLPPLVERTLARLIRAFAPERILLFGSRAKGLANDRSDVDLLVIAHVEGNPAVHQRRAKQLASDCFPRIDVIIATPEDVADAARARSPFLASILGSGITLYTRPTPEIGPAHEE